MYSLYKEWCMDMSFEAVSDRKYRDIFNTKFNLGFGSPRSDTCAVCDASNIVYEMSAGHKEKAANAFDQQQLDKELAPKNRLFSI